jgi:hypothetical protein
MTQYDYTKTVNFTKIVNEFKTSALPFDHCDCFGDSLSVFMTRDLADGEKTTCDNIVSNHTTTDMAMYIQGKILAAMDFGKNMMSAYGAQNVMAGLTVSQVQTIMEMSAKVQTALLSGSLYVALIEINNITPDGTLITQTTLDNFRHNIQDYLGIART